MQRGRDTRAQLNMDWQQKIIDMHYEGEDSGSKAEQQQQETGTAAGTTGRQQEKKDKGWQRETREEQRESGKRKGGQRDTRQGEREKR